MMPDVFTKLTMPYRTMLNALYTGTSTCTVLLLRTPAPKLCTRLVCLLQSSLTSLSLLSITMIHRLTSPMASTNITRTLTCMFVVELLITPLPITPP